MISWLNFEELLIHNPIELINFSKSNIQVALSKKQYIDFFSNKSVYMGLYYDEEMDFCVMFYADPLQSVKDGDVYAQGYIDVDMKIYRLKVLCNVSIKLPFVAPKTITAPMSQGSYLLVKDAKIYSGKDVTGTVYLDLTNCPCDVRIQFWSKQGMILGNFVKAGEKGYSRFSGKVPVLTGPSNIALYWKKTADPNLTFSYSEFKIEEGSNVTPYMQAESETTSSDLPKWNVTKTGMLVSPQTKQITTVQAGALMRCGINNNISGWTDGTTQLNYSGQDFVIDGYGMRGLHNG